VAWNDRGRDRAAAPTPGPGSDTVDQPAPGLRALVASDLAVWAELYLCWPKGRPVTRLAALRLVGSYAGLRATLMHRLAHALYLRGVPIVPLILANLNITLHGFDAPPAIKIGPRFYVPHPVGTVVTAMQLGARVTLVSGVTIGMRKEPKFPTLGDDVYVGAGARILGEITIGDRVQIGANAVVVKDVPSDSVAVGVPATIRPARPHD
jgi:serine O-acetyltransferase